MAVHGLNHGIIGSGVVNLLRQTRIICNRNNAFYGVPGYNRKALDGYDSRGLLGEDRNGTLDPVKAANLPSDIQFVGFLFDPQIPDDPADPYFGRWYIDVPQNDGWGARPQCLFAHTVIASDERFSEAGVNYRRWVIDFRHDPNAHVNGEPGEYPFYIRDVTVNLPPRARQGIRVIRKVDWDAANQFGHISVATKGYALGLTGPMRLMNDLGCNMTGPSETQDPDAPVQYRHVAANELPEDGATRWWVPPPAACMELVASCGQGPYITVPEPWTLAAKVDFIARCYALRRPDRPGCVTNSNEAWHPGGGFQQFNEVNRRAQASGRTVEQQHVVDCCQLFDALANVCPEWDFIWEWQWVTMVGQPGETYLDDPANLRRRLKEFLNYGFAGKTLRQHLTGRGRPGFVSGAPYNGNGMVGFPNPRYVTVQGIKDALDAGQQAFNTYWKGGLLQSLNEDIFTRADRARDALRAVNVEAGHAADAIRWRDYEEAAWNPILKDVSFAGLPFTRSAFVAALRSFARSPEIGDVTRIMAVGLADRDFDSTAFAGPGPVTPARLFDNGSFAMADKPAAWRTQHPAMDYQAAAETYGEDEMTGLTDTFDGAAGGKLADRPNWTVTGNAGMVERTYVDGSGNLVIKDDFGSPLNALYGPSLAGGSSTRWDHPRIFEDAARWPERARLELFGGGIEINYDILNNRYEVKVGSSVFRPGFPVSQRFTVTDGVIASGPSEISTVATISADRATVSLTMNGEAAEYPVDITALPLASREGQSGLFFEKAESFASPRIVARSFSVDDGQGGGTPTPTPGPAHTVGDKPRFLPRTPGGNREERFVLTKTGGGTITGASYRLLALVGTTETAVGSPVAMASPAIASDNSTITGTVLLPVNRAPNERWVVETTVAYSGGATSVSKSAPFAVGALFAYYGQSNSVLRRIPKVNGSQRPTGAFCFGHLNPTGTPGSATAMTWRGPYDTDEVNTMLVPAGVMAAALGMPVGFFSSGKSGAGIDQMLPGGSAWEGAYPSPNGDDAALTVQIARAGGAPEGVIFDQGENNANQVDQTGYRAAFRDQLVPALRQLTGRPALPIAVVLLGRYNSSTPPGNASSVAQSSTFYQSLRAAQVQMVEGLAGVGLAGSSLAATMADEYHYDRAGFELKGARDAQALLNLLGVNTYAGTGPRASAASIAGTTVRVPFALLGANDISGTALTGYETSADGGTTWASVPTANASVVGGAVELRNRPAATNRVRSFYGMNYDESSLAVGNYSAPFGGPAQIPLYPIVVPLVVSAAGSVIPVMTQAPVVTASRGFVPARVEFTTPPQWENAQTVTNALHRVGAGAVDSAAPFDATEPGDYFVRSTAVSSSGDTRTSDSNTIAVEEEPAARKAMTVPASRIATALGAQPPTPRGSTIPAGASPWGVALDPEEEADFGMAFDADLLPPGIQIAEIVRLSVNAVGAAAGVRILDTVLPFIDEDGRRVQVRFGVNEADRASSNFAGTGMQADVTIRFRTDAAVPETRERTFILPVRHQ